MKEAKPKRIIDAINSPIGSIGKLVKTEGEIKVKALIVLLISDLISFFNIARGMNDVQVAQTAELLIECYPYFTPEDFILCFKNMKLNKYIKLFEGIDGNKIIECVHLYDQERSEVVVKINQEKNEEYKQELKQPNLILKEVVDKMGLKFKEKKVISEREKTPTEKLFYFLFNEFLNVYKKQYPVGSVEPPMKIVSYNGNNVEVEEYCNNRFKDIIECYEDDFFTMWEQQGKPKYKAKSHNIELFVDCVEVVGIRLNINQFIEQSINEFLKEKSK